MDRLRQSKPQSRKKSKEDNKKNQTVQPLQTKTTEITNKQQSKHQKTETRQAISVSENQNGGLKESVQNDVQAGMKEKPKNLVKEQEKCKTIKGQKWQGNWCHSW